MQAVSCSDASGTRLINHDQMGRPTIQPVTDRTVVAIMLEGLFGKESRLTFNLIHAILSFALLGMYTEMQAAIFPNLPGPIGDIYNYTLREHYGIEANEASLSLMSTVMSFGMVMGLFLCGAFLLPLMDKKGRRFLAVNVRFLAGASAATCQILAGTLGSAEFYFLGQVMVGLSMPLLFLGTQIYMTECAPDKHRGFVSTSIMVGPIVSSLIMYFICSPSLLGTPTRWTYIPMAGLALACTHFLCTFRLPDSPKWLLGQGRDEEAREAVLYYQGSACDIDSVMISLSKEDNLTTERKVTVRQLIADDTLREAIKVIMCVVLFMSLAPANTEGMYMVVINTKLGLTVQQSLNLNLFVHLFTSPFRFMGTTLIDRFGRRIVAFTAAAISILKLLIMVSAQSLVLVSGATTLTVWMAIANEILSELYAATGVMVLGSLLISELIPPAARVSAAQLTMFIPLMVGMPLTMSFPIINTLFAPAFYFPQLCIFPFMILYLYRHLPETKGRSVYDIVHNMDVAVRSRANTRFSMVSEKNSLLPSAKGPHPSYMAV